jgi:hypothetical protein
MIITGTTVFAQQNKNLAVEGDPVFKGTPTELSGIKITSNIQADLLMLEDKVNAGQKKAFKTFPGLPERTNPYVQTFDKNSRVLVDIAAKGDVDALKNELQSKGAVITGVYGRVISAIIPVAKISEFGTIPTLQNMKPAYKPVRNAGLVTSQGDKAQRSDIARANYGVDGLGIRVGVLSDSYNGLGGASAGVASGDLPSDVIVLRDYLSARATDEGRAMMEIVHDVAPKAKGAFASAFYGEAAFASDILNLAFNANCPIIVDDIAYFAEPFFQDGIIAQAIDYVKSVKNVSYFSAAGNNGKSSYDNAFNPSSYTPFGASAGTAHNFSKPGDAPRYFQPIYIPPGGEFIASLQWDDSFYSASGVGAKSDLDIYLLNPTGTIVAYSFEDNLLYGDPSEILYFYNNSPNTVTYYVSILKYGGVNPNRIKYINFGNSLFYNVINPYLPGQLASTLYGHSNASGAMAIAAARYNNTPAFGVNPALTESFSSIGGVPILFNTSGERIPSKVRVQPSVTAPDGANTTFFYPGVDLEGDGFPNFFGTSAAAPHAAGVAALLFDAAKRNLSPAEVKNALQGTAQDMDDQWNPGFQTGWDLNSGYGLIRADLAVNAVKPSISFIAPLALKAVQATASGVRNWVINNTNKFNIRIKYVQKGSAEASGEILVLPGSNSISLAYLPSADTKNSLTISWKDQTDTWKYATAIAGEGTPVRLADVNDADIEVIHSFPNPAVDRFNVALNHADIAQLKITIYDVQGKQLPTPKFDFDQNVLSMQINDLASGLYVVKLINHTQEKTIKMIKQ